MANGVVVLGMHRSGTSAATRLINMLGVPIPEQSDLLPPAFDNPRGHWESRSLVELNDRVLASQGCDWTCPVRFEKGWEREPAVAELVPEARAAFFRTITTRQWVWKDPRNCLALPFWMAALDVSPVAVLVLRHPSEIVASLHARDGFERQYCLALWERYLRVCLRAITGLPTTVTTYDDLLADPLAWCERVGSFLAGQGVDTTTPPSDEVVAFVDPKLRHARPDNTATLSLADPQEALVAALHEATRGHEAFEAPALPEETPTTEELLTGRRMALAAARDSLVASEP